ncbi:GNAT family acetyltransferase [Rothia nasimurium]|uniref:GNAT family acetyltransferase n=1 Tax=Rothia nasimurium TaxID=85336 RepID=A0A1Y1RM97_9MICC|nr:GNAT family N-acetyltransferase [Rothia nasimurium]ORC15590.1 GNAT family acetyltransferase [Rothia nasimurium]
MSAYTYRALTAEDTPLLEQATLGNMNWCGPRFTRTDVRTRPEFAHYTRYTPVRGDFGIAAYQGEEPAGAAWALYLPADDPGYGFIDEATPEISLWVAEEHRGLGLGRALLKALISEAAARNISQISLSVEADNLARNLYLSEGFTPVAGREKDGVMLYTA